MKQQWPSWLGINVCRPWRMGVNLFSRGARVTEQNTVLGSAPSRYAWYCGKNINPFWRGLLNMVCHGLPWFAMVRPLSLFVGHQLSKTHNDSLEPACSWQVSWREVMDLPFDFDCYRELRDYFNARSDVPPRLLAPGPKNNQVIIFQAKGPLPPTHSVRGNFRREVMYLCWWLVGRQLLGNHPTWRNGWIWYLCNSHEYPEWTWMGVS